MNGDTQGETLLQKLHQQEQEIARLHAEIDRLSRHDALTGALNRHTMIELLTAELRRSQRTGQPFCMAVIEVDDFGVIGDRYGSPASDVVLARLARTACAKLRSLDAFGRLDDKSFGILLPATWLDEGVLALKRLAAAVKAEDWASTASELAVSFSAGLTTNAPGDTAEIMIGRAMEALAQARQEGGDRIATTECDLPPMPPLPED